MTTDTAFVLTLLVLCYAVVSGLVKRWYLAPALIFVLCGMVLGPFGFDVIEGGTDTSTFTVLAQLALTVILFNQAAELDLSAVIGRRQVTFRLLVIGIPLAIALGVGTALLLFPVMPTVGGGVSRRDRRADRGGADRRPARERPHPRADPPCAVHRERLLRRLRAGGLARGAWRWRRSGTESDVHWGWFLVRTELVSVAVGLAVGAVGGWVIGRSRQRGWMSDTWAQLATLAVALVCFQVGEMLHGSGFVAAFAGGLAFALRGARRRVRGPRRTCPMRPGSYSS